MRSWNGRHRVAMTWTIAGERLALLAWPRAILLQLAHPLVAAGVAQHSGFRSSPFAPFARLHATVGAMRQLTFGTDDEAAAVVRRILGVHDRVNGTLRERTGPHESGQRYSAHDPALLLWVHATLLDSHVRILEEILRPFTTQELDSYCREAAPFAVMLGARPGGRAAHVAAAAGLHRRADRERARDRRRRCPGARAGDPAAGVRLARLADAACRRAGDRRLAAARDPGWLRVHLERHPGTAPAARARDAAALRAVTPDSFARWPEARACGSSAGLRRRVRRRVAPSFERASLKARTPRMTAAAMAPSAGPGPAPRSPRRAAKATARAPRRGLGRWTFFRQRAALARARAAHRASSAGRLAVRGRMLDFRVELRPDEDGDARHVQPQQHDHDGADAAVGGVVVREVRDVQLGRQAHQQPQHRAEQGAGRDPGPVLLGVGPEVEQQAEAPGRRGRARRATAGSARSISGPSPCPGVRRGRWRCWARPAPASARRG